MRTVDAVEIWAEARPCREEYARAVEGERRGALAAFLRLPTVPGPVPAPPVHANVDLVVCSSRVARGEGIVLDLWLCLGAGLWAHARPTAAQAKTWASHLPGEAYNEVVRVINRAEKGWVI